jgi:hypothetical protein
MKKAFDANVSRARPKLRLGAMLASEAPQVTAEQVESLAQAIAQEPVIPSRDLSSTVKARLRDRATRPSAVEALTNALQADSVSEADAVARVAPPIDQPARGGREESTDSGAAAFARPDARARDMGDEVTDHVEDGSGHDEVEPFDANRHGATRPNPMAQASRVIDAPGHTDVARNGRLHQPVNGVSARSDVASGQLTSMAGETSAREGAPGSRAQNGSVAMTAHQDVGAPRAAPVPQASRVVDTFARMDASAAPVARSEFTSPSASAVSQSRITEEAVMPQPRTVVQSVRSAVEAPAEVREVQTAPTELPAPDAGDRRERLRERLKAVRENPRPEPLPETVAEAGVLAVERIAALQTELTKTRAMNLALSQDLEAARRQAERATEEARLRMDEARRLSAEMEGRAQLLADLEKELSSLEGERNEALLALQEARASIEASEREKVELQEALTGKDEELEASLQEEERLASELEAAHEAMTGLRRSADALKGERDTLARQVSDLTKERAELLEARKALEAVHRALAKASAVA